MKYKKWRDLSVDFYDIKFKKTKIINIISYPPAGNDVVECNALINNIMMDVFIKYKRSKITNFKNEYDILNKINNLLPESPQTIEFGVYDNKEYIVLEKKVGSRISDIFKRSVKYRKKYLFEYGKYLAKIHNIDISNVDIALQRPINDIPNNYPKYDNYSLSIIKWLFDNNIKKNYNTFIHGDFHYANVLFKKQKVSGVLDFEYSGLGFKEQDIAWACVLRPGQKFMNSKNDIDYFLLGYSELNSFDFKKFVWCYINSSLHFYLMNMHNEDYKKEIRKMIDLYMLSGGE